MGSTEAGNVDAVWSEWRMLCRLKWRTTILYRLKKKIWKMLIQDEMRDVLEKGSRNLNCYSRSEIKRN